jgi:urease accessory protein
VTRLRRLRQSGALKLVFPRSHGPDAEVVLVNTAGGITGGDRFCLTIEMQARAQLTLTTQAAERAYHAQPGEDGRYRSQITVGPQAVLRWLPQELILFEGSSLRRELEISLAEGAQLLMVEPIVFGRVAMPEELRNIRFEDRIRVLRAGQPLYLDGLTLTGDATAHLAQAAVAEGAGALASVVFVAPEAERLLADVRGMLPRQGGASLIAPDVLVVRLLAADSYVLRQHLCPLLRRLSGRDLPISWRG